jgi:hypothetical protein
VGDQASKARFYATQSLHHAGGRFVPSREYILRLIRVFWDIKESTIQRGGEVLRIFWHDPLAVGRKIASIPTQAVELEIFRVRGTGACGGPTVKLRQRQQREPEASRQTEFSACSPDVYPFNCS